MRYIRTKNGIYEIKHYSFTEKRIYVKNHGNLNKKCCLEQADTIEELCDLYVMVHLDCERTPDVFMQKIPLQRGYKINKDYIIYGAIWTDEGLIYVAKMNDKGCLELL